MQLPRILFQSCLLSLLFFYLVSPAFADTIQFDTSHMQVRTKQSAFPSPTITPQQTNINPVVNTFNILDKFTPGYVSFSIDNPLLSFADLSPTSSQLRETTLHVKVTGNGQVTVLMYTDGPLQNISKLAFIPPTSCDNGLCDTRHADTWINTLTYGVGYNCESVDIECFMPQGEFRQLPTSLDNYIQIDTLNNSTKTMQLLYKINTAASQRVDTYATHLTYLVLPKL